MSQIQAPRFPVDAVITWVDGRCPGHQARLNNFLAQAGMERPDTASPTRYNACGEIRYCLLSLLRFAPWIRTIYLVTDAQIPPIMDTLESTAWKDRVKLVDHRELFRGFESCLPTFNSLSIETMLWRIEGLANHFLYLNDDCFMVQPVSLEDFYQNDQVVIRGTWKTQTRWKWTNRVKHWLHPQLPLPTDLHRNMQEGAARMCGWERRFFHLPHMPFALRKETFSAFAESRPELFADNAVHRFRNPSQYWAISMAYHLEILQGNTVTDNRKQSVTIHGEYHSPSRIRSKLRRIEKDPSVAFLCAQSLDQASGEMCTEILAWLERRICGSMDVPCSSASPFSSATLSDRSIDRQRGGGIERSIGSYHHTSETGGTFSQILD